VRAEWPLPPHRPPLWLTGCRRIRRTQLGERFTCIALLELCVVRIAQLPGLAIELDLTQGIDGRVGQFAFARLARGRCFPRDLTRAFIDSAEQR